jgi:hypothetical protein
LRTLDEINSKSDLEHAIKRVIETQGILKKRYGRRVIPADIAKECARREQSCELVEQCLASLGTCPLRFSGVHDEEIVATRWRNGCLDHGDSFSDYLALGWEQVRSKKFLDLDTELLNVPFIAWIPHNHEGFADARGLVKKVFTSIKGITNSLHTTFLGGAVQAVLVMLPPVNEEMSDELDRLINRMSVYPAIAFYLIPPPPSEFQVYFTVIDKLLSVNEPNVIKPMEDLGEREMIQVGLLLDCCFLCRIKILL